MEKTRDPEKSDDNDLRKHTARNVLIGKNVLNGLGEPSDLLQIQVRPLWNQNYRVNILVGGNFASARVANSYFLKVDEDGNPIESTPRLKRQY